jgi:hypothetical protein
VKPFAGPGATPIESAMPSSRRPASALQTSSDVYPIRSGLCSRSRSNRSTPQRTPQVVAEAARAAQARVGEARVAPRAVSLAVHEVVPDGAHEPVGRAPEPGDRTTDEAIGLALAVDVGRHDAADLRVGAQQRDEPVVVERDAVVQEASAAPGAERRVAEIRHGRSVPRLR